MSSPARRAGRSRTWLWVVLGVLVLVVLAAVLLRPGTSTPPSGDPGPGTTTGAPAPTTTTPTQPADCPAVEVLLVPGTYETSASADPTVPVGLLAEVGDGLAARFPAGQVSEFYVPYPAQFGNPMPYEQSRAAGVTATRTEIEATGNRCPLTKFAVTGFSQGAAVAGDVATTIGNGGGPVAADRVVGVGLVADPYRQPGQVEMPGPAVDGVGIGGPRAQGFGALADRTATLCAPGDLVCDTPRDALAPQNLGATLAQLGTYLRTNVHSSYGSFDVGGGTTGTQWLVGRLGEQIAGVVS